MWVSHKREFPFKHAHKHTRLRCEGQSTASRRILGPCSGSPSRSPSQGNDYFWSHISPHKYLFSWRHKIKIGGIIRFLLLYVSNSIILEEEASLEEIQMFSDHDRRWSTLCVMENTCVFLCMCVSVHGFPCLTCFSEGTSLEEQVRRIKDIEAIESDSFVPQAFKSSRDDTKVRSVPLSPLQESESAPSQDYSLPMSIVYDDSDTLAHPSLFMDKETAEDLWLSRLNSLRQERLMGSPVA
uniref:Arginine/serine-rich coiled-coil 1 n=1 Tax=Poecilia latipinna TaxID=48699 RepID=A0A3B3VJ94_9TELE